MVFRLPQTSEPPKTELFFPESAEVERAVTDALDGTSLFAGRFREAAARALLLPRRQPGKRTPLWAQRKRASDLLAVASQHRDFPIVLETYRECLRDVFDLPGLVDLLRRVESRRMRVVTVDTQRPSPFAASLLFSFVANFIYDGDAPLAERRAQALSIDHARLRELLGEAELRQLLDPEVITEHERTLQRFTYPAKHADAVHDMLLSIGDLTESELAARTEPKSAARRWTQELFTEKRAVPIKLGGEMRFIAAEDTARYRDALGVMPPRGVPAAFLEPVADPLGDLVSRYARTHGPFTAEEIAARLTISPGSATFARLKGALAKLTRAGRVVEGAFLRNGAGHELCDAEVLRVLRRKSLARLRREVEPVDEAAYARFLCAWHGVGALGASPGRSGPDALLEVIGQLEGCALPATALLGEILPARVANFQPWDIDALTASGEIVWAGVESLGPSDGRIALYLADHEPLLALVTTPVGGELHEKIRTVLSRRGAVFFAELVRTISGFPGALLDALWDMVWSGEVTNDTLEPLRSWMNARHQRTRPPPTRRLAARSTPPGTEGRWSLRASRWTAHESSPPADPQGGDARVLLARVLLERYGVVTREVAHAESLAGGFSAVYDVLKAMEEAGRIRRGYFVAGRGATQFALPGADDRLRASRQRSGSEARVHVLAATDPANPYGASLAWPVHPRGKLPQRAAAARVILRDGALVGWFGRREEQVLTFIAADSPDVEATRADLAVALASLVDSGARRALLLTTIDGERAFASPLAPALIAAGFTRRSDALFRARSRLDIQDRKPALHA
jgi:ATP-dependent Lhr-like helicase